MRCLSESKFWNDTHSVHCPARSITAEIQADVWCAPRNAEWLLSVVKKSNQAEYAQYGSDSWRDTRALIRARFSNDSVVKHRYSSRSPYDYSDKGGGLDNVMLNNNRGAAAMQQQDTRVPLNLRDASSNPLMLFLHRDVKPEIPRRRRAAPVAAATNAVEEEEKEKRRRRRVACVMLLRSIVMRWMTMQMPTYAITDLHRLIIFSCKITAPRF